MLVSEENVAIARRSLENVEQLSKDLLAVADEDNRKAVDETLA